MQLMMRGMVEGVPSERDRLLRYGTGEFYQELSLYIEESEARKRYIDKINKT